MAVKTAFTKIYRLFVWCFHSRGRFIATINHQDQGYSWHRLPDPSWANITGRFRAALLPVEATDLKMDVMKMGCVGGKVFFHGKKHLRNIYNKANSNFGRGCFVCLCLDPFFLANIWSFDIWLSFEGGLFDCWRGGLASSGKEGWTTPRKLAAILQAIYIVSRMLDMSKIPWTEYYTQQICKEGPFRHLDSLNPLHGTYLVHQMGADSSNLQIEVLKFEVADISHHSDSSINKYYHGKHMFESHVLFVYVVLLSSTTKWKIIWCFWWRLIVVFPAQESLLAKTDRKSVV